MGVVFRPFSTFPTEIRVNFSNQKLKNLTCMYKIKNDPWLYLYPAIKITRPLSYLTNPFKPYLVYTNQSHWVKSHLSSRDWAVAARARLTGEMLGVSNIWNSSWIFNLQISPTHQSIIFLIISEHLLLKDFTSTCESIIFEFYVKNSYQGEEMIFFRYVLRIPVCKRWGRWPSRGAGPSRFETAPAANQAKQTHLLQ